MTLDHLDTIISFVVIITGVSLLITSLTQMVSALLGLRGTNLRWGIETLLKELDPNLEQHAATIAEKVLHHPLISDSTLSKFNTLFNRWKLASTVRKDELINILNILGKQGASSSTNPEPWVTALNQSMDLVGEETFDRLAAAQAEIKKHLPDDPERADKIIKAISSKSVDVSVGVHQWFDSMMDRVSQRFVVHTRWWTVIFALILTLGLHLDTFTVMDQLSTNADLRNRLVSSSDALLKKADEILATSPGGSAAFVAAMKQLKDDHPNDLKALPEPSGFANLNDGKKWLDSQLVALKSSDSVRSKLLKEYESAAPQAALRSSAANFDSVLVKLKFQFIPDPYPSLASYWTPNLMHLGGTLLTAALLSLGAPFWFNILKTLSNLRPVLAKKTDEEKQKDE